MPATARPTQAHSHAGGQAGAKPKLYNPRHPERTLLYQTIAEHFETTDDGAHIEPQIESDWATDWDGAAQPAPDFEVDQRVNW